MKLDFPIVDDNYIIIQLNNKKALIATGINYSLSNEKSISILDKNFSLDNQYMGFSLQDINQYMKSNVDYVLGSNILSQMNLVIDKKNKLVTLSDEDFKPENNDIDGVPLNFNFDIPNIQIKVHETNITAILDTVSNFCYLNVKNIQDMVEIGEKEDFMIGMGHFKSKLFQARFTIGKNNIMLETGFYPSVISKSRFLSLDKGIIGCELLSAYKIILNSSSKTFYLIK